MSMTPPVGHPLGPPLVGGKSIIGYGGGGGRKPRMGRNPGTENADDRSISAKDEAGNAEGWFKGTWYLATHT